MPDQDDQTMTPLELRKQLLITQGAMYRSGIVASKEKIVAGLHAESLARSVIKQVGLAVFSVWRSRSGFAATGMPAVLPLVIGGISRLWRKPARKRVTRVAGVIGAVASTIVFLARFKKK